MNRIRLYFAFLISFLFFAIGFLTIREYGVNWDEPIHYMRGQAYLRYFLTGKKNYNDLPKLRSHYVNSDKTFIPKDILYENDSAFRRSLYQMYQPENGEHSQFTDFIKAPVSHPPTSDVLSAFFNYIFYQKTGLLGDIESYHVFIVLTSAFLVGLIFYFTSEQFGIFSAIVSVLSLSLYPLFFAESHVNIKDPIEATFYAGTLIFFYYAFTKKRISHLIISAVFFGLALGTKLNIIFSIVPIVIWLAWLKPKLNKKFFLGLILYPVIVVLVFSLFFPNLWVYPVETLQSMLGFYRKIGYGVSYQPNTFFTIFGFNTYPMQLVLFTTPLVTLVLFIFSFLYIFQNRGKDRTNIGLFIVLWFITPIVRVMFPGVVIYAGARQIMEYIPAIAILSGIGAKWIVGRFRIQWLIIFAFVPIISRLISMHPNQSVYFNPLIGGLKGAAEKNFPDWGVTLGSVYWQGIDWVNKNAEPEAKLALLKGLTIYIPNTFLRADIQFGPHYYSGNRKDGEYLMEVIEYYFNRDIKQETRDYLDTLRPVYEVKVDEVAILKIWKNDQAHVIR